MKRIFCVLLCLALFLSAAACKPDNIAYPSVITNPTDTQPGEPEQPEETPPAEEPEDQPVEEPLQPTDEAPPEVSASDGNPLAAADFQPSGSLASALPHSGIIRNTDTALANRTLLFYTADEDPAFTYQSGSGGTVSEWDWMTGIAADNGFSVKYMLKNRSVSLKAQRVALFAGRGLSLIQLHSDELAEGLTLCRSAASYLNMDVGSFGISKAVLNQSDQTLFAPVGAVNTLWYDPAALPEGETPETLIPNNRWTVSEFQALCTRAAAAQKLPLILEEPLAWGVLSGRSPLALSDGRLTCSLNTEELRTAYTAVRETVAQNAAFLRDEDVSYTLQDGTVTFVYSTPPEAATGQTLRYAPLPALNEEGASAVTFTGVFFALPKYGDDESAALAALTFAELWCNRYTEALAGNLKALGVAGADYQAYAAMAEEQGQLLLRSPALDTLLRPYLTGLTDPTVNFKAVYSELEDHLNTYIAIQNLYY